MQAREINYTCASSRHDLTPPVFHVSFHKVLYITQALMETLSNSSQHFLHFGHHSWSKRESLRCVFVLQTFPNTLAFNTVPVLSIHSSNQHAFHQNFPASSATPNFAVVNFPSNIWSTALSVSRITRQAVGSPFTIPTSTTTSKTGCPARAVFSIHVLP